MAVKLLLRFDLSQSWPVKRAINQYYGQNEDKNLCFLFIEQKQLIWWEGDGGNSGGVLVGSSTVPVNHLPDGPQVLRVGLLLDLQSLHEASGAGGSLDTVPVSHEIVDFNIQLFLGYAGLLLSPPPSLPLFGSWFRPRNNFENIGEEKKILLTWL